MPDTDNELDIEKVPGEVFLCIVHHNNQWNMEMGQIISFMIGHV